MTATLPRPPGPAARSTEPPGGATLWDLWAVTERRSLWLTLSVLFSAGCAAVGLWHAFRAPYVVQDDARTFLFWMERFFDPELFPRDLMADYFAAVSPPAYTALHWVAAVVFGIDPFVLNKLLPVPLGIGTTVLAFRLSMRLLPNPAAAFAAATILTESLWLADAIPSGTPRAFVYPLLLIFLDSFAGRRYLVSFCAVVLLGLFYPQMLTIALGALFLAPLRWEGRRLRLARDRRLFLLFGAALAASLLIVGWATALSAPFGPVVTADQARSMIEFTYSGRTYFYTADFWKFWWWGERTGIAPYGMRPPLIWLGLLLPILARFPDRFPLVRRISPLSGLLWRVVIASFGMYAAAHLLLFRFHLPSRFTQHSLRIVLSLAAGAALVILLDGLRRRLQARAAAGGRARTRVLAAASVAAFGLVAFYPSVYWVTGIPFPKTQYVVGTEPGLYQYLASQPKDIVVASLSPQTDLIPSFSRRSILTGYEYSIPYHVGYYDQIRRRTHDLLRAQYSSDPAEVRRFIVEYGVTFWLIDQLAFTREYVTLSPWIQQTRPEAAAALASLDRPSPPIVARLSGRCLTYLGNRIMLLDAACLKAQAGT